MKHAKLSNPVHLYLLSVYALTSFFFSLLCTRSLSQFWFPLRFCVAPALIRVNLTLNELHVKFTKALEAQTTPAQVLFALYVHVYIWALFLFL